MFICLLTATRSAALKVTNHSLTLRPASQVTVDPLDGCEDVTSYRQCEGELSGRSYTWAQENQNTNYVLFILSRRATICAINLTYTVIGSEPPKVSACAALNDTSINDAFANLTCQEITIQATGGEITTIIDMPFASVTNRVALEIITTGIKASFTVTSVQFFGTNEVMGKYQIIYS